jgi:hypothetical protein
MEVDMAIAKWSVSFRSRLRKLAVVVPIITLAVGSVPARAASSQYYLAGEWNWQEDMDPADGDTWALQSACEDENSTMHENQYASACRIFTSANTLYSMDGTVHVKTTVGVLLAVVYLSRSNGARTRCSGVVPREARAAVQPWAYRRVLEASPRASIPTIRSGFSCPVTEPLALDLMPRRGLRCTGVRIRWVQINVGTAQQRTEVIGVSSGRGSGSVN